MVKLKRLGNFLPFSYLLKVDSAFTAVKRDAALLFSM